MALLRNCATSQLRIGCYVSVHKNVVISASVYVVINCPIRKKRFERMKSHKYPIRNEKPIHAFYGARLFITFLKGYYFWLFSFSSALLVDIASVILILGLIYGLLN